MKRTITALALITASTLAMAQYTGPNATPGSTVKQVLATATDDQYVTLKGHLIAHETDKKYTFDDGSGKVQVEIPEKLFPTNNPIAAGTLIQIGGKYDKDRSGSTKIKVKQLNVI